MASAPFIIKISICSVKILVVTIIGSSANNAKSIIDNIKPQLANTNSHRSAKSYPKCKDLGSNIEIRLR